MRRSRCIRHLARIRCRCPDLIDADTKFVGNDLRNLDVQALPHLRAAVVKLHGAVTVDVHKRTGLVQQRRRKRDAELDRRDGDATPLNTAGSRCNA